jgi:hypothetical protein
LIEAHLALSPDSSETFAREVDENLRRDQMRDMARAYGKWLIAALLLFLAGVAGWLYWQDRQQKQSQAQSEDISQVYTEISQGRADQAAPKLDGLAKSGGDIVRASALLTQAAIALEKNDRATAIAKYRQIANDGSLPDVYRDLGTLRSTALEFDSLRPEEVIARLQPLAQAGKPWFGSAGELTAMAYLKQNQRDKAGKLFAAIAADKQVPDTLRSRAVQIAGTLGVDASASLPNMAQ